MRREIWILILIVGLGAGCGGGGMRANSEEAPRSEEGNTADESEDRTPVEVVTLERGPMEAVLRSSANLEAENRVQVFSRTLGLVRDLRVEEGDLVRRGALLLRLDDEEQRASVERVSLELAQARREHDRQEGLFQRELISEQAFNEAVFRLEQLELALEDAMRELAYTEVRAPISGTVSERLVNLGDQVTPNQHLFDIVDFGSIVARIFVPERELPRVRVGQPARVLARALGTDPVVGEIERISPVVDPRTGTVRVTVAVPRRDGLRPGMFVDVSLVTDVKPDALRVPKRALVYDADRTYLFRLTDQSTVERVPLRVVLEDRDFVEPATGFEEGDRIVVAGQAGLRDGAAVRVLEVAEEAPDAGGGMEIGS